MEKTITITPYKGFDQFPEAIRTLLEKSREARLNAYTPYSGFKTGAAVYLANGSYIKGCNQENRAFPSGLCAERVALFAAGSEYPGTPINAFALFCNDGSPENVITPCGSCRQVLFEFRQKQNKPFPIYMAGGNEEVWYMDNAENLLPFPFVSKINNA